MIDHRRVEACLPVCYDHLQLAAMQVLIAAVAMFQTGSAAHLLQGIPAAGMLALNDAGY